MTKEYTVSKESQDRIGVFTIADKLYKDTLEKFEESHKTELEQLDKLRDDRNAKLDEAKRSLRAETEAIDEMRLTYTAGPFKVQKKWSDFYIPEKFALMLKDHGLYDTAVSAKVIGTQITVAKYDEVQQFLKKHGVLKDFESCEDGQDASNSISGPKQVPPFGAELKKE